MPRSKPDQVVTHRVELGTKERKMLEEMQTAKLIKDVGIGVGIASVGIGGTYVAYKIGYGLVGWADDLFDDIKKNMKKAKEMRDEPLTRDSFNNPLNNDGYAEDGTPTNWLGLPGWGIWPGVL